MKTEEQWKDEHHEEIIQFLKDKKILPEDDTLTTEETDYIASSVLYLTCMGDSNEEALEKTLEAVTKTKKLANSLNEIRDSSIESAHKRFADKTLVALKNNKAVTGYDMGEHVSNMDLKTRLIRSFGRKDYVDVANIAMMLHFRSQE